MKILIFSNSSALGGLERRIAEEAALLKTMGHEVVVATPRFREQDSLRHDIERAGARHMIWTPYKFMERGHLNAPFRLLARGSLPRLRREHFDFAHIALPYNFIGMSVAYLLSREKIPFVVSVHCVFGTTRLSPAGERLLRAATRGMVGGYAVSRHAMHGFSRAYEGLLPPGFNIRPLLNGVETERFKPDVAAREGLRQKLGLNEEDFVVIFCGRIHAIKRPMLALAIFEQFAANVPAARLLVVGDGPDAPALREAVATRGLAGRVKFAGHVSDVSAYFAAADCYISTSMQDEGFSLTTAEALATGLPCILPDEGVYCEVYGQAAAVRLCSPEAPQAWSAALQAFASCPEGIRDRIRDEARAFIRKNLSREVMYDNLRIFYAEMMEVVEKQKGRTAAHSNR
ncbi:glycosyltransferase family 4 protein [Azoarcus sp. L1K30]|uniref:glycosyltransferase family 4 protein n=1 Tax=Azoarcus sp. L1K30 TaxID=2820277 RepID=UPI001B80F2B8|nr:glycosyltransferase family 4 protein [Azoarcus sp. L1K30]MBR0566069.1 glycosyltransferase family 4 protein [Azoarcus sp. L1K30]